MNFGADNNKRNMDRPVPFTELDNYIDFDKASTVWRENKKKISNGAFAYICHYVHTNKKRCRRSLVSSKLKNGYIYGFGGCTFHDKYYNHANKDYFCSRHINRFNPTNI